jgi:large subunit ribosomal protein L22
MNSHTVKLNGLRLAPRKVRLVADLVRGLSVNEAEARLSLDRHRAAKPLLKLLRSAIAGARQKELDPDALFISEIRVDQGVMMKRFMARAQGRGVQIQKKSSHIILGLGENPSQGRARFTVPQPKKRKSSDEPKRPAPRPKKKPATEEKDPEKPVRPGKKEGIVKRTFGRKSGEA